VEERRVTETHLNPMAFTVKSKSFAENQSSQKKAAEKSKGGGD
jgi:hypothetical protein